MKVGHKTMNNFMSNVRATRLSTNEDAMLKFTQTVVATYRGKNLNTIDAIIASVKTGAPFKLHANGTTIHLVIGMLDMHNEPWDKKTPLFYGYQINPKLATLKEFSEIQAMWLGEITTNPRQIILRQLKEHVIPATVNRIGSMRTEWEWRTGFMDGIEDQPRECTFDVMAQAMKNTSLVNVLTSMLIGGLGYGRRNYRPAYLPVQLERAFPWVFSEAIWCKNEEPHRRHYHGGFALMDWSRDDKPNQFYAFRAGGYFFTAEGEGGSFQHEGPTPYHVFSDATFDGLKTTDEGTSKPTDPTPNETAKSAVKETLKAIEILPHH
jgi:hypothetical protein